MPDWLMDFAGGEVMGDTPAWWFFVALPLAGLVIGVAKSGFGGGVGIVAVPLTASALPIEVALGVMLPVLIAADVVAVAQHRRAADVAHLRPALVGAAAGIALGTGLLVWLGATPWLNRVLSLVVGAVCLLFVGVQGYRLAGGRFARVPDTRGTRVGAGALAGGVSTLAHAAGPIMTVFLLEQRMEKRALTGTLVVFFFVVNVAKLLTYVWVVPMIDGRTLRVSLLMAAMVPAGSLLGLWLHRRVPEKPFAAVMYVGAALAAGHLVLKSLGAY